MDPSTLAMAKKFARDSFSTLADGVVVVKHGANADFPRPVAGSAYWQGSVAPNGKILGDTWLTTSAYD